MKLILTCEHAGNKIPEEFRDLFSREPQVLNTHRGFDPGAKDLFNYLKPLAEFSKKMEYSRLLVEVNRSLHHPQLFSSYSSLVSPQRKKELLQECYLSYRQPVEQEISRQLTKGDWVLHLSIHSFTPVLSGVERQADIGLLYDPRRKAEKEFCLRWQKSLRLELPQFRIRLNYPYRGTSDGFTTYLRRKFPQRYLGLELEVNQKFQTNGKMDGKIKHAIHSSVEKMLAF